MIVAFVFAVVGYFAFYALDQHLRVRKGGWQVEFQTSTNGEPRWIINQPTLGITNVQIRFPGGAVTNPPGAVVFDTPKKQPLQGKLVFHDLTYLPGVIVIDHLGHQIQLVPRTLVLDKRERGWTNGAVHELEAR